MDQFKATADAVSSRAQELISDKVKPTLFDAYQSASDYITGQDVVGQASSTLQTSQRKAARVAKDISSRTQKDISSRTQNAVNGLGGIGVASDVQLMSGSPARNLRNAGNAVTAGAEQAVEIVGPVANRVGELVKDGADRGLVAWEQFGRREAKQFVKHAQEVRSQPLPLASADGPCPYP